MRSVMLGMADDPGSPPRIRSPAHRNRGPRGLPAGITCGAVGGAGTTPGSAQPSRTHLSRRSAFRRAHEFPDRIQGDLLVPCRTSQSVFGQTMLGFRSITWMRSGDQLHGERSPREAPAMAASCSAVSSKSKAVPALVSSHIVSIECLADRRPEIKCSRRNWRSSSGSCWRYRCNSSTS